jgi:hypothetical protein
MEKTKGGDPSKELVTFHQMQITIMEKNESGGDPSKEFILYSID